MRSNCLMQNNEDPCSSPYTYNAALVQKCFLWRPNLAT